ncbi:MAG: PqqD family protein [Myxococcota bacterium]
MNTNARTLPEPTRVYRRNPDTATRPIAGETFILAIRGELASLERMFVLDDVGLTIWNSLDGNRELRAVVAQITDNFDVDHDTAMNDVVEFLEGLRESGLVLVADEEGDG